MRLFLLGYVIVALVLNFMLDDPLIFYLAVSAFPVAVYLLLSKPKKISRVSKEKDADKEKIKEEVSVKKVLS